MSSPRTIIQLTRAFIHDSRLRRTLIFYITLVTLLMVFAGSVLLDQALREHPLIFLVYWGICGWFTLAILLLAFFDLLAVRSAGRQARRELENELISEDDDPHAR